MSVPDANTTTTITVTSGVTVVSAATATSSVTATVPVTGTTVYAACATSNLADAVSGAGIVEGEGGFQSVTEASVDTAYDYCVAAVTFPGNTDIWAFQPPTAGTAGCYIGVTGETCPNPATNPCTVVTAAGGNLVMGIALCGAYTASIPEDTGGD